MRSPGHTGKKRCLIHPWLLFDIIPITAPQGCASLHAPPPTYTQQMHHSCTRADPGLFPLLPPHEPSPSLSTNNTHTHTSTLIINYQSPLLHTSESTYNTYTRITSPLFPPHTSPSFLPHPYSQRAFHTPTSVINHPFYMDAVTYTHTPHTYTHTSFLSLYLISSSLATPLILTSTFLSSSFIHTHTHTQKKKLIK